MEIPKPTAQDKQFFLSLLPQDPAVEIKPMFGNVGAFVHGNMFAGLFGPAVGVRLDEGAARELAAIEGSGPFGPPGHSMGGYQSLPEAWRGSPEVATGWVEKALTHVRSMPPKVKKAKAARPKPKAARS